MDIKFVNDVTVDLIKTNASDIEVARAAWVSTKGEDAREADSSRVPGLINYLVRNRHGSPFEHNSFTFFIKCPIFVVREFHRHRAGWSYNEESGRYTELKPEFYIPSGDRNLVQTGKAGEYRFEPGTQEQAAEVILGHAEISAASYCNYQNLLSLGVAKEVARMTLPLNIMTTFYATANSRAIMHFLSLRTQHEDATFPSTPQKEISMVADKIEAHFAAAMPHTHAAYVKNGRVSP
jgi:thymidylate synthase (FAD)